MAPVTRSASSLASKSVDTTSTSDQESTSSKSSVENTSSPRKVEIQFKYLEISNHEFSLTNILNDQSFKALTLKLNDLNVQFSAGTSKDFLLGATILMDLKMVKRGGAPNEEFAIEVGKFAQLDVPRMRAAAARLGIEDVQTGVSKKDMLRHMIRQMIVKGDPHWLYTEKEVANAAEREAERMSKEANAQASKKVMTELDIVMNYKLEDLSHDVINLLIATVCYQMEQAKGFSTSAGCPKASWSTVLTILKEIPVLKSHADLTQRLTEAPSSPSKTILNWICDWFGTEFTTVPKAELIPGFPSSVIQFFISGSTLRLMTKFYGYYTDAKEESQIVFCGTPLRNLRGIVYAGFDTKKHLTTEPRTAIAHAMKDMTLNFSSGETSTGEERPYPKSYYGAVLACEYVHGLKNAKAGGVFKEADVGRVLGRYVFLVPNDVDLNKVPKAEAIEEALLKGFAKRRGVEWEETAVDN